MKLILNLATWMLLLYTQILAANAMAFTPKGGIFANLEQLGEYSIGRTRQVTQDKEGFIWVATDAQGLHRYDGSSARKITLQGDFQALSAQPRIESFILDGQFVWILTADHGLFRYDKQTRFSQHYSLNLLAMNGLLVDLQKDSKQQLYVMSKQQIARFDRSSQKWTPLTNLYGQALPSDVQFKRLFIDSQQRFWLITDEKGIYKYAQDQQVTHYSQHATDNKLEVNGVLSAFEDSNKTLWFGTAAGVAVFNESQQQFDTIKLTDTTKGYNQLVTSFAQKDDAHLWLGTVDLGVMTLNTVSRTVAPYSSSAKTSLNNNEINHLHVDRDKTLWVSTELGVSKSDVFTRALHYFQQPDSAQCHPIGLTNIDSGVYFGCGNILYRFSQSSQTIEQVEALPAPLLTILAGQNDTLWLGTLGGGLARYQINSQTLKTYAIGDDPTTSSQSILKLYLDDNQRLWGTTFDFQISQQRHLFYYDDNADLLHWYNIDINPVTMTQLDINTLMFSSFMSPQGPYIFDIEQGLLTSLNLDLGMIYSSYNDGQAIWLGSSKKGLVKFNYQPNNQSSIDIVDGGFTAPFGLIGDDKNGVFFHDNDKLYHYRVDTESTQCLSCRKPFVDLVSLYRGSMAFVDGQLLVGSANTLLQLNTEAIPTKLPVPEVYLSDLSRFNKIDLPTSLDPTSPLPSALEYLQGELTLTHKDSLFSIHLGSLALLQGEQVGLFYQLEGLNSLENEWLSVPANFNAATFTTLPAGSYQLKVKALNQSDGQSTTASLGLTIKPAPWLSWPAKVLYLILLTSLIFASYRWRIRALKHNAQQLKQGIRQRTLQLNESNQQLTLKNDTISSLLAQKRRMFANMTHELRTPLTLILSPLERLLKANISPDNHKFLVLIDRNARQLLRIINQLLNLAQLESSNRIEQKNYKVNSTIKYIVASFEAVAIDKNLSISSELSDEFEACLVSDSLETMFANLLSNAIKYTPNNGNIQIKVEKRPTSFMLSVSDTGLGISKNSQKRIFEPFYRDTCQNKSHIEGSGVGLALVKEMVEVNDGQITLTSNEGQGSRFEIELPTKTHLQSAEQTLPQVNELPQAGHHSHQEPAGKTVSMPMQFATNLDNKPSLAIIEDNPQMREFLFDIFSSDYHCLPASGGKEGIMLITEQIPDLIICDLMMPDVDGFMVCNTLKNDERTSHIPILLLTAKGDVETRIEGWQQNIDDFVCKPFIESELKARLANLLTIRQILAKRFGSKLQTQAELLDNAQLTEKDNAFLTKFAKVIEDHLSHESFNRTKAAAVLAVSERQLQRKLAALTNYNFTEFVRLQRLRKAKSLLAEDLQVSQVVEAVGFSSISYFGSCFKAEFEMTPKQYQLHCRKQREPIEQQ